MRRSFVTVAACAALLAGCQDQAGGGGGQRDQIRIVGSSTVRPFASIVAEQYRNRVTGAPAPFVEATGTGAGFKQFCAGVGERHPDIANASRRIKASEYAACKANGAGEIVEIQIGIDGIALGEAKNGPKLALTSADIYRALAAAPLGEPNTARTWADVNPSLPAVPIKVYGPPSTSGTRDALAELVLAKGCETVDATAKALKDGDKDAYEARCTRVREDGVYVDQGENDNLIVQKLQSNPEAIGVFGYSYLEENLGVLNGVTLNGVRPTYDTIASGEYPGARPLYIYVKSAHLNAVPGLKEYLNVFAASWGPDGPLVKRGFIAAPADVREKAAATVKNLTPLDPAVLK